MLLRWHNRAQSIAEPNRSEQTGKRDALRELEKKYQARWAEDKLFEIDAPPRPADAATTAEQVRENGNPKWMGNTPYAYMNGSLHVGHSFTVSKVEFDAGFRRMQGKRALFPVGYHCTGLPIKVSTMSQASARPLPRIRVCKATMNWRWLSL